MQPVMARVVGPHTKANELLQPWSFHSFPSVVYSIPQSSDAPFGSPRCQFVYWNGVWSDQAQQSFTVPGHDASVAPIHT